MRLIAMLALLFGCESISENPIEEWAEDVIMENTGISVDLTGESPEEPKGDSKK